MIPAASFMNIGAAPNPIDILMSSINTNPYFIGTMMLLLNLGGRFLSMEVTKGQEKFLSRPDVRRFFLFAVLFVATRNFVIAAGLAIIVIFLLGYLFNENSELCLWRSYLSPPLPPHIDPADAEAAAIAAAGGTAAVKQEDDSQPVLASQIYRKGIEGLRNL